MSGMRRMFPVRPEEFIYPRARMAELLEINPDGYLPISDLISHAIFYATKCHKDFVTHLPLNRSNEPAMGRVL
jgi:hypothetical protein